MTTQDYRALERNIVIAVGVTWAAASVDETNVAKRIRPPHRVAQNIIAARSMLSGSGGASS